MNRVPVVPLELILSQDGATGTRKPSKPLPPLFPPAWGSKRPQNIEIEELGKTYIKTTPDSPYETPDPPLWARGGDGRGGWGDAAGCRSFWF